MSKDTQIPKGFYPGNRSSKRRVIPLEPRPRHPIPLSAGLRMRELLKRPDCTRLVRTTPIQDLYLLVKQVGLDDSIEVLELATADQLQRMIDLDVWKKDRLDVQQYDDWFRAVIEAKDKHGELLQDGLDQEAFVFFLQTRLRVHLIDEEAPEDQKLALEGLNTIDMPDHQYLIELAPEDPLQDLILKFLDGLYGEDVRTAQWLLEAIRWEPPSLLEETAYRLRSGRCEELGFFDFIEAQIIYQPPAQATPIKREAVPRPSAGPFREIPLPLEYLRPADGTLLFAALEHIRTEFPDEDLTGDLMHLANKVLAADQLSPSDLEQVRLALHRVRSYINLALEMETGEVALAASTLRACHLEWLFQRGYSEALTLKRQAHDLLGSLPAGLRSVPFEADPHYQQVITGLLQHRPQFWTGLSNDHSPQWTDFGDVLSIQQCAASLDECTSIFHFTFKFLAPGSVEHAKLMASVDRLQTPITPTTLFLSSLANRAMGGVFAPEPLNLSGLRLFLSLAFVSQDEGKRVPSKTFRAQVFESVEAYGLLKPTKKTHITTFVERALDTLEDAYAGLEPDGELCLKYIGGPLLLMESKNNRDPSS